MKKIQKPKVLVLSLVALMVLFLCGCAPQRSQMENIGATQAKNVALADAGLVESQVGVVNTELSQRDGMSYYTVSFTAEGKHYRYDIDALTGVVIQAELDTDTVSSEQPQSGAGIISADKDTRQETVGGANGATITSDQAKAIALTHAGLEESQVTFVESRLDFDNGRQIYDVEFYTADYMEYDYEIDAATGEVYSYDFDAESYTAPISGNEITAAEAKTLALEQVPGATETDIVEFETDRDDGRISYEGKIYYNGMEYEFEIDGYSGSIRSWEAEPIR